MLRASLAALILLLALPFTWTTIATADGVIWVRRDAASPPNNTGFHSGMAYDAARRVVLYFIAGSPGDPGRTWEWDGLAWTLRETDGGPPSRRGHAMAYDASRERIVLFGGTTDFGWPNPDPNRELADTWEWDGQTWELKNPATSPPGRREHALAYDSARRRVILFGGITGPYFRTEGRELFADTWEWDGEEWVERTPPDGPAGRRGHGLAYDAARDRTVLVGGFHGGRSRDDVWEYDGSAWDRRFPDFWHGYGRHDINLVYDEHQEVSRFWGGVSEGFYATTLFYDEVSEWNGAEWLADWLHPSPPGNYWHNLAYDSFRRETVLLTRGGVTWVYRSFRETICDGADDDGNGLVDERCEDLDGDGWCATGMIHQGQPSVCPLGGGDCDDLDPEIHPAALDLPGDGLDADCDGLSACDPKAAWRNHGEFVSCVARSCRGMVREGLMDPGECSGIVREAAGSTAGR